MQGKLYTDGGARGNPGPAAIGYVLTIDGKEVEAKGEVIGKATNNQAEYEALIKGLSYAKKKGVSRITCYLDSELVVKQMRGEYRVKDIDLKKLFEKAKGLTSQFALIEFIHIRREKNKQADKLVNLALDKAKQ